MVRRARHPPPTSRPGRGAASVVGREIDGSPVGGECSASPSVPSQMSAADRRGASWIVSVEPRVIDVIWTSSADHLEIPEDGPEMTSPPANAPSGMLLMDLASEHSPRLTVVRSAPVTRSSQPPGLLALLLHTLRTDVDVPRRVLLGWAGIDEKQYGRWVRSGQR